MRTRTAIRIVAIALSTAAGVRAARSQQQAVELDRVVAVVNNRAILASDLREEMRVAVLEPPTRGPDTPQTALERLISRTLIRQQIREQEQLTNAPSAAEVAARIDEVRKDLPECVRMHCESDEGWKAFLAAHDLSEAQVEFYVRDRMELLRFIEDRFRQGIQISQDEIETYYMNMLVPQYLPGQTVPTLAQVSQRIEEILLQQKVNALFSDWLESLRKQGDIEVLDASLEDAKNAGAGQS